MTENTTRVGFVDGTKIVGNTALNIAAAGAGLVGGTANILAVTINGAERDTFIGKMRDGRAKETFNDYKEKTEDFYVNIFSPTKDIHEDVETEEFKAPKEETTEK